MIDCDKLKKQLLEIYLRKNPPHKDSFYELTNKIIDTYIIENPEIREKALDNSPGGIIRLKEIPTIIIPDLHARMEFILHLVVKKQILEQMQNDELQIVCIGDGMHAESRAYDRWLKAFDEFSKKFKKHPAMDEEMRESFGLMEMIMLLKISFPDNFHFLKGNHENIANESGRGNHAFGKFAYEGEMVKQYVIMFYGQEFLKEYYKFEKLLPLMAVGKNFIVTHAEPQRFFDEELILNYNKNPEVIYGLTWTDNDAADDGSVDEMLRFYLSDQYTNSCLHFGGHRPIKTLYNVRASGKYLQIHNPSAFIIAEIQTDKEINIETDIIEIENDLNSVLGELKNG